MKGHFPKAVLTIICISFLQLLPVPAGQAQDEGFSFAGYQWGGDIELGYRFTDIEGRDRFKEVSNLTGGVKLFDFTLWGNDPEKKGFVDSFRLNLNGIGDPFPSGRFEVKKSKAYDFTVTYSEYKYFFARTENDFLTDNFSFNQKTRRGTLSLSVFPTDDFRLNVGYNRVQRDGDAFVPRPFVPTQKQDLDEVYNEYFVSGDFSVANVDLHVKQSYWTFENKDGLGGPFQPESRDEEVDTYVSTIKAHTQLGDRWDLDGGYIYAHSEGRAILDTTPILVDSGRNTFNFNTHVVELGLTHLLRKELLLHLDYRFHTQIQDGRVTNDPDIHHTSFDLYANTGTVQLEYIPNPTLTLRGGYRIQYRNIDFDKGEPFEPGVLRGGKHPDDTNILTHGWIGSADWKPYKYLSLFGEYQGSNFDNPYTRISPENENIAKVRIKYDTPLKNLSLTGTALWRRRTNPDQDYRIDAKDFSVGAAYQPSFLSGLTADGSVTYELIKNKKDISVDNVPVFSRFTFDSNAWILSGGLTYEGIYRGLGARIYGSYARTRDENSQKYADGLISVWYKNKYVTPTVTLERSYLTDKVKRSDSFNANLLTFSLRKDF